MRDAYDKVMDMVENNRVRSKKSRLSWWVAGAGRDTLTTLWFSALRERKANLHRLIEIYTAPTGAPTTTKSLCGFDGRREV